MQSVIDSVNRYWRQKWSRMSPQQRRDSIDRAEGELEQREFAVERERIFYHRPKGRKL
jgi:hypothetical protein